MYVVQKLNRVYQFLKRLQLCALMYIHEISGDVCSSGNMKLSEWKF
jgi:hypothetical protein